MLIGEPERVDESYRCPVRVDVAHPYFFERELDERIPAATLRLRCPVA